MNHAQIGELAAEADWDPEERLGLILDLAAMAGHNMTFEEHGAFYRKVATVLSDMADAFDGPAGTPSDATLDNSR